MSRYHPVRPKQQQPERPQTAQAKSDQTQRDHYRLIFEQVWKLRNGDILNTRIERWKATLALYDREREAVAAKAAGEGHRWTVSPTIALRIDMQLEKLIKQREELEVAVEAEAHALLAHYVQSGQLPESSLCPPKHAQPASPAAPQAQAPAAQKGGAAEPAPIAA